MEQIILFDGVCHLCQGWVKFVLRHDSRKKMKFAPLQSEAAKKLLGITSEGGDPVSVVFYDGGKIYRYSDAALQILIHLGGFWRFAAVAYLIPRFIRDAIYRWVAKNRYRWFGKSEACYLPKPEWKERFL